MTTLTLKKPHRHSFNHSHGLHSLLLILLLLMLPPPPATAQLPNVLSPPPTDKLSGLKFDKSMAIVLVILVVVFFMLGFLSIYTRQCTERGIRGRFDLAFPIGGSNWRHRGLDPEIIDSFPTFVYSAVKGLKIGRATLECAVCLNEFRDHETLRLIPKCSHVFHAECVDAWLVNQSTCPVCRANLLQGDAATTFVAVQIPDPEGHGSTTPVPGSGDPSPNRVDNSSNNQSPKVGSDLVNQNRPVRSRSTGFRSWFPRSHSTGHSLGEDWERFTLRLPEEVRNRLVNSTLNRTTSCGATFMRVSSGRSGYRARSVGRSPIGGSNERSDRRFFWTPPFVSRAGSTRSPKPNKAMDDMGERSSDRLFTGGEG
ncbi:RING-H2 finger protein ATL11-like [Lotus japonicus]|uniref:RING-H2 finger protein ATL11-like n=1 Tax=Lotus japonicus TaxID=34305 RepID=UPI00258B8387|nr:RING-H2 finger protein ATL11-like [Lotus japonicus]